MVRLAAPKEREDVMRVLVCGGRDYTNRDAVFATLDVLKKQYGQLTIIQGGAPGAEAAAAGDA